MLWIRLERIPPFKFESIVGTAFFEDGELVRDRGFEDDLAFTSNERIGGESRVVEGELRVGHFSTTSTDESCRE